jgi:hypothetical protein
MDEGLGPTRDQRTIDNQHLGLLSLFHFIGAGLAVLGLGFVLLHYALMGSLMNNPALWQGREGAPPDGFFDIFRWFYLVLGAWMGASLVLNLLAAVYLRAKKHRIFCIVVAAWNCLHTPIGTVLGIFTIIVLARSSVRTMFDRANYGIAHVE